MASTSLIYCYVGQQTAVGGWVDLTIEIQQLGDELRLQLDSFNDLPGSFRKEPREYYLQMLGWSPNQHQFAYPFWGVFTGVKEICEGQVWKSLKAYTIYTSLNPFPMKNPWEALTCTTSRKLRSRHCVIFRNRPPDSTDATATFSWKKEDIGEGQEGHGRENYTKTAHISILEPKWRSKKMSHDLGDFFWL